MNALVFERRHFFAVVRRFLGEMTASMTRKNGSVTLTKVHSHLRIVDTDVRVDSMGVMKTSLTGQTVFTGAMIAFCSPSKRSMSAKKIVSSATNARRSAEPASSSPPRAARPWGPTRRSGLVAAAESSR
jgi:hypothetical protein